MTFGRWGRLIDFEILPRGRRLLRLAEYRDADEQL
jgi:hypothetical protein